MTRRPAIRAAFVAMALIVGASVEATAQRVERREPSMSTTGVLARSTILGAGAGLVLGGTYALVADESDTGEVLRWSLASGAAGGLLYGLIETLAGDDDSSDEEGALQLDDDGFRFSMIGMLPEKRRDMADVRHGAHDFKVFRFGT